MLDSTVALALIGGLSTGAATVWFFMRTLFDTQKKDIALLEKQLRITSHALVQIVTAIEYTDTLHDEHNLKEIAKEIKLLLNKTFPSD